MKIIWETDNCDYWIAMTDTYEVSVLRIKNKHNHKRYIIVSRTHNSLLYTYFRDDGRLVEEECQAAHFKKYSMAIDTAETLIREGIR